MNRLEEYIANYIRQEGLEKHSDFSRKGIYPSDLDYDIFQATHAVVFDIRAERNLDWSKF